MSDDSNDRDVAIREQRRMFRLAERDHGLTRKVLSIETGIPEPTLKSWGCTASDKILFAIIPLTGLRKLCRVIPEELVSLLFTGTGKHIAPDEPGDGDLADLEAEASGVVHEIAEARRDGKITPSEHARIKDRTRRLVPVARGVAA